MSVSKPFSYPRAPIYVDGAGLDVELTTGGGVGLNIEYPDHGSMSRHATLERYIEIAPEDWDAIVEHVAADRATADAESRNQEPS